MSTYTTRPARKADASEIALLVNIALHGGIARGWAASERAEGTYDPIEVGRLDMMDDGSDWGWRSVTMAECDGEVVGMMLGYREPEAPAPIPVGEPAFMRPINELEAEAAGTWFISMLGVHVGWRGRGVGSQLLKVADGKRTETNARATALIVEDANDGARRLYARSGYEVRAERPMVQGGGARGRDWLLMVKD